jgi:hypothetical protein
MNHFIPTCCSVAVAENANHLAMAIGEGPADGETWVTALHRDAQGNHFIVRNLWVPEGWLDRALGPLTRPEWDTEKIVDLDKAEAAQEAVLLSDDFDDTASTPATVGKIIACTSGDMDTALAAWGLELIPQEEGDK